MDTSEAELEKARASFPELTFLLMDAFDIGALCALREKYPFNKILLDVNGSRDPAVITKLLRIYGAKWSV